MTNKDKEFMKIALEEAKRAYDKCNYPVGAVLVINGEIIDKVSNSLKTSKDWSSHAEATLVNKNSKLIKSKIKNGNSNIELFTTLEPCLMCLGTAIINRVSRIVYACKDPHGGATGLDLNSLPDWYKRKWPMIDSGVIEKESYDILVKYMKENLDTWSGVLKEFENMSRK